MRMWKITFFGLKSGQDWSDRGNTPTKNSQEYHPHPPREIGPAQLCSVTEIAPRSPLLYVNRSPILYGFRVHAKTIRYNMKIALIFFKFTNDKNKP